MNVANEFLESARMYFEKIKIVDAQYAEPMPLEYRVNGHRVCVPKESNEELRRMSSLLSDAGVLFGHAGRVSNVDFMKASKCLVELLVLRKIFKVLSADYTDIEYVLRDVYDQCSVHGKELISEMLAKSNERQLLLYGDGPIEISAGGPNDF